MEGINERKGDNMQILDNAEWSFICKSFRDIGKEVDVRRYKVDKFARYRFAIYDRQTKTYVKGEHDLMHIFYTKDYAQRVCDELNENRPASDQTNQAV